MRSSVGVRLPRVFSARIPSRSMVAARAQDVDARPLALLRARAHLQHRSHIELLHQVLESHWRLRPAAGFCARIRSSSLCAEASYATFCSWLSWAVGGGGNSVQQFALFAPALLRRAASRAPRAGLHSPPGAARARALPVRPGGGPLSPAPAAPLARPLSLLPLSSCGGQSLQILAYRS